MRLLYTIVCFFQQKNRKTDHIHVLHCHHNIRKASDQEQQLVKQACELYKTNYLCIKKERKEKEKKTERDLRKRRHEAFVSYMQQKNISDLFLGHNLDDRIETTFLNISR
ncbi:hypothetical protein GW750_01930 [bacterium]|nr:hypothetical protein [bacterium]